MSLVVNAAATSFSLTTLPRVKQEFSLSSTTTTDDTYIKALIKEASDVLAHETYRVFAKQQYTETIAGNNRNVIMLRRFPVISVDQVTHKYEFGNVAGDLWGGFDEDVTTPVSTLSTDQYYIEDADVGFIYKKSPWISQQTRYQNIEAFPIDNMHPYSIKYTAGWVLPSTLSTTSTAYAVRTLPYDLESACITLVSAFYNGRGRDPMIKSDRTGDAQITLFDVPYGVKIIHGLPQSVYRTIEKYKVTIL